jgi:hypothetical protein
MNKLAVGLCAVIAAVIVSGCASSYPQGVLYTKLSLPVAVGDAKGMDLNKMKKGESTSQSILALVAIGDSSIDTAAKNAGIKTIFFVDWNVENILGLIGTYKCTVYGE